MSTMRNTPLSRTAAEQYRNAVVPVHPGKLLCYVLHDVNALDKTARDSTAPPDYDAQLYIRLLQKAAAEVLSLPTNPVT